MASIKPIDATSRIKIQSGQVIVDLCSVVKELVENSLDAGATSIDVRFKNQGLDAIEVQDNGRGIPKEDYESIALKHHTSKLRTYTDLTALRTFGFRGEALSALAALATLTLTTCTAAAAPSGDLLAFSAAGALLPERTRVVAAQRGTTVRVERLFAPLPVRRHELERNGKREYGKVLALLQAYACVSTGVRVGVSNVMGRGRSVVFATNGNVGVRENVANVFGARAVAALVDLGLELEMEGGGERNDDG